MKPRNWFKFLQLDSRWGVINKGDQNINTFWDDLKDVSLDITINNRTTLLLSECIQRNVLLTLMFLILSML